METITCIALLILLSALLIAWAGDAIYKNDLYLPVEHGNGGYHVHGLAANIFCGALLAFAASCVSLVVGFFDKRRNGRRYAIFFLGGQILAGVLALCSAAVLLGRTLIAEIYRWLSR